MDSHKGETIKYTILNDPLPNCDINIFIFIQLINGRNDDSISIFYVIVQSL